MTLRRFKTIIEKCSLVETTNEKKVAIITVPNNK